MKVRRFLSLGCMVVMLCAATFVFPGTASAHAMLASHVTKASVAAASCTDDKCDGKSPVSTGCENDAVTERSDTSGDLGRGLRATIHLNFSLVCHAAWAKVEFNKALPDGTRGNAVIERKEPNKKQFSCESPGGNAMVQPMQTTCYSPMLGDDSHETTLASAWYYNAQNDLSSPVSTSPF